MEDLIATVEEEGETEDKITSVGLDVATLGICRAWRRDRDVAYSPHRAGPG